jgi:hypothetical protein
MYILTHSEQLENCKNKIYRTKAGSLEKKYLEAGCEQHERSYPIECWHKEYRVFCPVYQNNKGGSVAAVIIPDFHIPGRPYPIYVYLYAIELYSNNPKMGQREAAERTRKRFGLTTFAHTTLGRALKVFVRNVEGAGKPSEEGPDEKQGDANKEVVAHSERCAAEQDVATPNQAVLPATQATALLRKRAARALGDNISTATLRQIIEKYLELARGYFFESNRLLL